MSSAGVGEKLGIVTQAEGIRCGCSDVCYIQTNKSSDGNTCESPVVTNHLFFIIW